MPRMKRDQSAVTVVRRIQAEKGKGRNLRKMTLTVVLWLVFSEVKTPLDTVVLLVGGVRGRTITEGRPKAAYLTVITRGWHNTVKCTKKRKIMHLARSKMLEHRRAGG